MYVQITEMLTALAEFSFFATVIMLHLVVSLLMLYFLKMAMCEWINREVSFEDQYVASKIPELEMTKVDIPFTFKLYDTPDTGYREISCRISSSTEYQIYMYWGVNMVTLNEKLFQSWPLLITNVKNGDLLGGGFKSMGIKYRSRCHGEKVLRIKVPEVPLELGPAPRSEFPLVVIQISDIDPRRYNPTYACEIVGLVSIIHVRDKECPLPTSVLSQYLKQASGELCHLRPLYLTSSGNLVSYETPEEVCSICQQNPISRALLPCRHTCVCGVCFVRITICPICRCPIHSYFCIRDEEYLRMIRTTPTAKFSNFSHFIDYFNSMFNIR